MLTTIQNDFLSILNSCWCSLKSGSHVLSKHKANALLYGAFIFYLLFSLRSHLHNPKTVLAALTANSCNFSGGTQQSTCLLSATFWLGAFCVCSSRICHAFLHAVTLSSITLQGPFAQPVKQTWLCGGVDFGVKLLPMVGWSLGWVFPRSWPFVENEIEVFIDSKVSKKLYFKGKQQFRLESTHQEDNGPLELKRKGPDFCFGVQQKEEFG